MRKYRSYSAQMQKPGAVYSKSSISPFARERPISVNGAHSIWETLFLTLKSRDTLWMLLNPLVLSRGNCWFIDRRCWMTRIASIHLTTSVTIAISFSHQTRSMQKKATKFRNVNSIQIQISIPFDSIPQRLLLLMNPPVDPMIILVLITLGNRILHKLTLLFSLFLFL